ncbi:hypothetical protein BN871_GH_00050 [Paenibacillus sp. P22]|nr:hypothetical protein BN871_GH_00050 [Paenibacillus sp. P22]
MLPGAAEADLGAHLPQADQVRSGDAAVLDVPDDRNAQSAQAAELLAHRVHVQQRLRGMLVVAVAGIDERHLDPLRKLLQHAGRLQPDDARIDAHRLQRPYRVVDGFALLHARYRSGEVQHLGAEALLCHFKAESRAGAVLEEHIRHEAPCQRIADLHALLLPVGRPRQDGLDLFPAHPLQPEQASLHQLYCRHIRSSSLMNDCHDVFPVHFSQRYADVLFLGGWHVLAYIIGTDRQLPVSAVHEHGKLDRLRPALIHQGVHRRADRASGVQDVIEQDDTLVVDQKRVAGSVCRREADRLSLDAPVIPVSRNVELAASNRRAFDFADLFGDPARQVDAAGADADQHAVLDALVLFDDFVGNPGESTADGRVVHDGSFLVQNHGAAAPSGRLGPVRFVRLILCQRDKKNSPCRVHQQGESFRSRAGRRGHDRPRGRTSQGHGHAGPRTSLRPGRSRRMPM